jgi:large subunit ribosomal protein L7e
MHQKRDEPAASRARHGAILARSKQCAAELAANGQAIIGAQNRAAGEGGYYVPTEAKVALVIRIRALTAIAPKSHKILQLLRLRQKRNAVFVGLNTASLETLRRLEPSLAYDCQSPAVVRGLTSKRRFTSVIAQRLRLSSNELVCAALKQFGIERVEDLAHKIYTVWPNFTAAARFFWSFKHDQPVGGFRWVRRDSVDGGCYGNRENLILRSV